MSASKVERRQQIAKEVRAIAFKILSFSGDYGFQGVVVPAGDEAFAADALLELRRIPFENRQRELV